jgi:NAD(P)-dependent dehydrogenase (short-subunit alcohol dehydrogenase family)
MHRVVLITGANKGLGFGMVKNLAENHPELKIILSARDESKGNQAISQLGNLSKNVDFVQLDADKDESVKKAADWVKQKYGGLDILINNAGVAIKGDEFNEEIARWTISTNYNGTVRVTEAFLPLIKPNGSIMNVSSRAGRLAYLSNDSLKARFLDPKLTTKELDGLVEEFYSDVRDGSFSKKGWPESTYTVSKIAMSMYTRILARDHPELKVNACCPGWCRTDMGGSGADLSLEEGIVTLVHVALLQDPTKTGKFWYEMKEHDWE